MSEEGPFFLEIHLTSGVDQSQEAYDVLHQDEYIARIPSFYHWFSDKLKLPHQGRLLDVACGSGEFLKLAKDNGLQVCGVDLSPVAVHTARQKIQPSGVVLVSEGEFLPFPDSYFDIVTNIGSLEHFFDPACGVLEMARVLRPGGKAYILVPNTFSLLTNVWNAFRKGVTSVDDQPIQRYGARKDWVLLFEKNGLSVRHTEKYERPWPRFWADWKFYLRRPKECLRLLATPFVPLNLAFCFLFSCEREP